MLVNILQGVYNNLAMTLNIVLTSQSKIKQDAVESFFSVKFPHTTLRLFPISALNDSIPNQPMSEMPHGVNGHVCAMKRVESIRGLYPQSSIIISIENEVVLHEDGRTSDVAQVYMEALSGHCYFGSSKHIFFPRLYFDNVYDNSKKSQYGLSKTIGNEIAKAFNDTELKLYGHDNWMKHNAFGGIDRRDQIKEALEDAWSKLVICELNRVIIKKPDTPKPGVLFQDLSNVLASPFLKSILIHKMKDIVLPLKPNLIMGLDARGFIYGSMLSEELSCGFVMARKKGKVIPGEYVEAEYGTEYSKDCLMVMKNLISSSSHVLIVDDLVATGGSLSAGISLVRQCGGYVVGCLTVLYVEELFKVAQEKLAPVPLYVVLA